MAVDEHMQDARDLDATTNPFKYAGMLNAYEMVERLNNAIRRYPKYRKHLDLITVSEEIAFSKHKLAIAHKNQGDEFYNAGTKHHARLAHSHFVDANFYSPGVVSANRLAQVREDGTENIQIEFANSRSLFRSFASEMVFSKILNRFRSANYPFLRVVEPGDDRFKTDEIVQIELDEAAIGNVNYRERIIELSRDSVFLGNATTDSGEVVKVYGEVTADYFEYCKTISTNARIKVLKLDANTLSVNDRMLFPSNYNWTEKWATYQGDRRALSKEQIQFARRSEPMPPAHDWLFAQTAKPLVSKAANYLRNEYSYLR